MEIDDRAFWGKAQPLPGAGLRYHPVVFHGLDVAAVFAELLVVWPAQLNALQDAFDEWTDSTRNAILALAAIHDIGKFAATFQAKVEACYPSYLGAWSAPSAINHSDAGLALIEADEFIEPVLRIVGPENEERRFELLQPVLGHHGRPANRDDPSIAAGFLKHFPKPSRIAALACLANVHALFNLATLPPLRKNTGPALSWRLAGLVALADWIGSDQNHFSYASPTMSMEEYWREIAGPRAKRAVAASGLAPAPASQSPSVHVVMSERYRTSLTDAQRWANDIPLPGRAGLFVIEDVMGSGKTEAALILAHRLMQAGQADGFYVALPTMATANALYARLGPICRSLFESGADPSLILAHGARDLHDGFRRSVGLESAARLESRPHDREDNETASTACARWLADDRRKTLLAHVGVGTVDQALLAVLPVKHAAVRQLGLSRKALIIDEAHAYDAYMQIEIEKLVELQAMAGAPVIILSATLPLNRRRALAQAHARGLGGHPPDLASRAYPLATCVGERTVEAPLNARGDLIRRIDIRRCDDPLAAEATIAAAAKDGAAVVYIRNTVDDAIETTLRLRGDGVSADLFHARFAMHDRLRIENDALSRFGRTGTPDRRRGRVLVATQVVEQSLDLDFDLMVTDLAPVDLMLQRAGRIWRHARDARGWPAPTLIVVSPEPVVEAGADWFAALFPRAQWVYRNHALLWRSAKELFASSAASLPDDIRRLVETVYDDSDFNAAPPSLQRSESDAQGRDLTSRAVAKLNVLDLGQGYAPTGGAWSPDIRTPTRLADDRRRLRLARSVEGRLVPWAPVTASDLRRAWALSEVSVGLTWFDSRADLSGEIERQAKALDADWANAGLDAVVLPLLDRDGAFACGVVGGGRRFDLSYSTALGLRRSDRPLQM